MSDKNKVKALCEGIGEELEALVVDLEFRVSKITKYKDEILKILDSGYINFAKCEVEDGK